MHNLAFFSIFFTIFTPLIPFYRGFCAIFGQYSHFIIAAFCFTLYFFRQFCSLNSKGKMKTIRYIHFILALFIGVNSAFADNINFFNDRFKIELSYPDSFQNVPSKDNNVILVLSNKKLNNNFNILAVPSSYDTNLSLGKQDHLLLSSYNKVGISDAIIRSSKLIRVAERQSFFAELAYNYGNLGYVATVAIIPADSKHFVATMVSPAGDYNAEDLAAFYGIIQSISLPPEPESSEIKKGFLARLFSSSSDEPAEPDKEETAKAINKPITKPLEIPDTAGSVIVVMCLIALFVILTKRR